MQKRKPGTGGLEVSAIGPGCMGMSWSYGPPKGTTKLDRPDENLGALKVELTPEDCAAIESASSQIKLEGARYPEFHEKLAGR
jgi:aryl-alcohol dehydrogenase-like predicted oxidoreductase